MPDEQTLKQHKTIYLKDYAPPDYLIEINAIAVIPDA